MTHLDVADEVPVDDLLANVRRTAEINELIRRALAAAAAGCGEPEPEDERDSVAGC